jgi:exonuclease III
MLCAERLRSQTTPPVEATTATAPLMLSAQERRHNRAAIITKSHGGHVAIPAPEPSPPMTTNPEADTSERPGGRARGHATCLKQPSGCHVVHTSGEVGPHGVAPAETPNDDCDATSPIHVDSHITLSEQQPHPCASNHALSHDRQNRVTPVVDTCPSTPRVRPAQQSDDQAGPHRPRFTPATILVSFLSIWYLAMSRHFVLTGHGGGPTTLPSETPYPYSQNQTCPIQNPLLQLMHAFPLQVVPPELSLHSHDQRPYPPDMLHAPVTEFEVQGLSPRGHARALPDLTQRTPKLGTSTFAGRNLNHWSDDAGPSPTHARLAVPRASSQGKPIGSPKQGRQQPEKPVSPTRISEEKPQSAHGSPYPLHEDDSGDEESRGELRILSHNVFGLCADDRQTKIITASSGYDIVFLQETGWNEKSVQAFRNRLGVLQPDLDLFYAIAIDPSRDGHADEQEQPCTVGQGVAILVKSRLEPTKTFVDPDGRHLIVRIIHNKMVKYLVCVYAPVAGRKFKSPVTGKVMLEQIHYFQHLHNTLRSLNLGPEETLIMAGDFNTIPVDRRASQEGQGSACHPLEQFLVFKRTLDKPPSVRLEEYGNREQPSKEARLRRCEGYEPLGDIISDLSLQDAFRENDAEGKVCTSVSHKTFKDSSTRSCARLDRIYVSLRKISEPQTQEPLKCYIKSIFHIHGLASTMCKYVLKRRGGQCTLTNTYGLHLPGDHSAVDLRLSSSPDKTRCPDIPVLSVRAAEE